ncbi:uncharacterized protein LOC134671905 [Cydia fagiglandana]|uniref:uncharacterized protein LOC134671905 n=1 Tax=Cydia fagiglandana TaxID=1458189 RepID=UPI002FEE24D3
MRARALGFFSIIIIVNNVNAGGDAESSIRFKRNRRLGYVGIPTKHRLALRSVEDEIRHNMEYMHSSILQFKSDVNKLKSYIPEIQKFEQLLADCEAMETRWYLPTTPTPSVVNGPTYPTEPPGYNQMFWYDPSKVKHIRHHHKNHNRHHRHNSHHRHDHKEHSKHQYSHSSEDQTRSKQQYHTSSEDQTV